MGKKKTLNYAKYGYIFSIPFVVAYLIFSFYPIINTFLIAFSDLVGPARKDYNFLTGDIFENFKKVLDNPIFKKAFMNTLKLWICNFIPQMVIALLLTAWFTDTRSKVKGQGFFKVVFYMPNIITAATVAILFSTLFGDPVGPMNDLLKTLGFIDKPVKFLTKANVAQNIVIYIQTWMWFGYTMITLISGVIGIDPAIFEAAEMDGSNRFQTFIYITIPCIRTIMLFTLVTSLIGGLNMFDIPKLFIANSGPNYATYTTSVFIQSKAFEGRNLRNEAAAASLIMFVIIVICSAALFYIMRDKDEAEARKLRKQALKQAKLASKGV
ncbi:MAG: sugar ABC transporter permease [Saccharofermentans sp.]|nr:sugar ABC transporter permease [Saccharofermentans sp.]